MKAQLEPIGHANQAITAAAAAGIPVTKTGLALRQAAAARAGAQAGGWACPRVVKVVGPQRATRFLGVSRPKITFQALGHLNVRSRV